MAYTESSDEVMQSTSFVLYADSFRHAGGSDITVACNGRITIFAWREHKYNDPTLHFTAMYSSGGTSAGANVWNKDKVSTADINHDNFELTNLSLICYVGSNPVFVGSAVSRTLNARTGYFNEYLQPATTDKNFCISSSPAVENKDLPHSGGDNDVNNKNFGGMFSVSFKVADHGMFGGRWCVGRFR